MIHCDSIKRMWAIAAVFAVMGCKDQKKPMNPDNNLKMAQEQQASITKSAFGTTQNGTEVERYTLTNSNGMEVKIMTYGGIITQLSVPDKNKVLQDVVLGFDSLPPYYLEDSPYFGALVGRYGNRIAKGKFTLDGEDYTLAVNNGENHLHGGLQGFDKAVWKVEEATVHGDSSVLKLSYLSKDMEEGYPGNLHAMVTYTLQPDNTLSVTYEATTDKPTVVNLTQHSYFNLSGNFKQDVLGYLVKINADRYVPIDEGLIPEGELAPVAGTPFDFRAAKPIGQDINADNQQLQRAGGFDHCWVINDQDQGVRFMASAYDPVSGRKLEVFSDQPGLQFYTGNFLDGTLPAKGGGTYGHRTGFCLETEHYPDSPNQPQFPSTVLRPGEKYETTTNFKFSIE